MLLTTDQLIGKSRKYLNDALNEECSLHTRYSAAMSALQCLFLAGVAEDVDAVFVETWEATRYEISKWPTDQQVRLAVERVKSLLKAAE